MGSSGSLHRSCCEKVGRWNGNNGRHLCLVCYDDRYDSALLGHCHAGCGKVALQRHHGLAAHGLLYLLHHHFSGRPLLHPHLVIKRACPLTAKTGPFLFYLSYHKKKKPFNLLPFQILLVFLKFLLGKLPRR